MPQQASQNSIHLSSSIVKYQDAVYQLIKNNIKYVTIT